MTTTLAECPPAVGESTPTQATEFTARWLESEVGRTVRSALDPQEGTPA